MVAVLSMCINRVLLLNSLLHSCLEVRFFVMGFLLVGAFLI